MRCLEGVGSAGERLGVLGVGRGQSVEGKGV